MGIYIKDMEMPKSCDECNFSLDCPHDQHQDGYKMIGGRPNSCPMVEVPEQKHGKWIWNSNNGFLYCSCCDAISPHEDQYGESCIRPNYCPNCGARMDSDFDV